MENNPLLIKLLAFRAKHITDRQFVLILSVFVGMAAGLAAFIIKTSVHYIEELVVYLLSKSAFRFLYMVLPAVGVLLVIVFVKYINRKPVRHGIPGVLYAISKNNGFIRRHNLYSSVITSAFTVGFGGSVGLEGPTVATGAAIGSNIGKVFKLEYKQIVLLLGCACTGAMAAIFKAPIAAIVFALEVIMLDLTMVSLVPLLVSSVSAYLVSLKLLGQTVLYPSFEIAEKFQIGDFPYYIALGVFAGFVSLYFLKMYIFIEKNFEKIKNIFLKLAIGGGALGIMIFLFPALYGEGYEVTNQSLEAKHMLFFENTFFEKFADHNVVILVVLLAVIFLKVIATSVTFGSGGVGGIFAPTLFIGASAGLFFAKLLGLFNLDVAESNFALAGMGGMIAGVIHAPLTAIFLIAEITGGYELFVPLMIVATISYATIRVFSKNSVYTLQLSQRGELITHHKDKAAFILMKKDSLLEKDFVKVHPDETLGDLVKAVTKSKRNVFPVVDDDENMVGVLTLNDIRHIMFKTDLYDKTYIRNIMYFPTTYVSYYDDLEKIAEKIETSGRYNVPVIKDGKYIGFVSRAKIFSTYRKLLKDFSEH
jgi:chloride channel protein, CIC family